MKQRLKYERINNSNDVITIDLHNGYTVMAISGHVEEEYTTTLFLKDNEIDTWREIEDGITFVANYKTINSAILKHVSTLMNDGKMDKYIETLKFELECTERGIEIVEKESLGGE